MTGEYNNNEKRYPVDPYPEPKPYDENETYPDVETAWRRYLERDNDSVYSPHYYHCADYNDTTLKHDPVKNPSHYQLFDGYEVKDLIKDRLTEEEWIGYIKGNMIKYHMRLGKKDSFKQDLAKLQEYASWLQEESTNV